MANGIGYESTSMSSVSDDIDLYRYKYLDYEEQIDGSRIYVSFVSPVFSVYERNRFYLLQNSKKEKITNRWKCRPDYVSFDKYGTTAWWQMLMWINDVKSAEYFTCSEIVVPDSEAVEFIKNEIYSSGGYIDINEDEKHKKTLYTLHTYTGKNISAFLENIDTQKTKSELIEPEDKETVFCREIFTMDIPTLRMKYVDLESEPIENSIRVIANCRPNLIYNKHYKLVKDDSNSMRRITWDPDVINNAGLLFKLRENDTVEVQYVKYV